MDDAIHAKRISYRQIIYLINTKGHVGIRQESYECRSYYADQWKIIRRHGILDISS